LITSAFLFSQNPAHHINLLDSLDIPSLHSTKLNDIWGYTDEFGNEYALVGTENGVSVVDVSDPTNANEIFWVYDLNSTWRDIKTYGDFAYITTEAFYNGLLIIDLTSLPNPSGLTSIHYFGNNWWSAHNLYIDENGFMYVFGADRGNGGVIIYDLNIDPLNPVEVGVIDDWYAHDGYVLNDTAYLAHITDGFFSIYDITDKSNPILIGTSPTPSTFTHIIWSRNIMYNQTISIIGSKD
jgi:choice-of-anchor B domain-containing protein